MFHKISIQWRLTILSAIMLTICCVGLTIVLNLSAFRLADQIDATVITTPAIDTTQIQINEPMMQELIPSTPSEELQEAKRGFSTQSILYMLFVILGGSALIYYVTGKSLKPLDQLNKQVKNITIHNLSDTLPVPPSNDEIAELTQSFNDMTDKLRDAFLTQERFSASAAHELRTPLAILQTKIDVFRKKNIETNNDYEALISIFEKQISRLRGLVGNLLDMTNMRDEREKTNISLRDMFEDIISELSIVANNKHVQLSLHCDNCTMYGNVDLLYRAFYNLVENAIKYNVDGGFVKVSISETLNKQVEIQVSDCGIGIPDEMKKHIFEPFYRVDKSRSRELGGAGLGLSIVDRIIKMHGGKIMVFDNEPVGTCFKICL